MNLDDMFRLLEAAERIGSVLEMVAVRVQARSGTNGAKLRESMQKRDDGRSRKEGLTAIQTYDAA